MGQDPLKKWFGDDVLEEIPEQVFASCIFFETALYEVWRSHRGQERITANDAVNSHINDPFDFISSIGIIWENSNARCMHHFDLTMGQYLVVGMP